MPMLCNGVNTDKLGLIGRKPDKMLNCVHIQANLLSRDPSARILRGGDYRFLPGTEIHDYWTQQPSNLYH